MARSRHAFVARPLPQSMGMKGSGPLHVTVIERFLRTVSENRDASYLPIYRGAGGEIKQ